MQIMHTHKEAWRMRLSVLCLVMLVSTFPSRGQYHRKSALAEGDHYHFGYVSGHVGYSILDSHATGVMPAGRTGGGVGVGYEYRNSGLWANVGLQYSMHRSRLKLDPYTIDTPEDQNYQYIIHFADGTSNTLNGQLHYDVKQKDEIAWHFIDVPILLGYYTHGFHLGAGLKLSYAVGGTSKTRGTYNLRYSPSHIAATYQDMPDRGLREYPFANKQDNRLNIGTSLIGEIGYDLLSSAPFNSRICHVLKLSFYFEYGLNNLNKGGDKKRFELPAPDNAGRARATDVKINPYLNTENSPSRTVPFFAGAKLTYMIGGSRTARRGFHHGCMCYN